MRRVKPEHRPDWEMLKSLALGLDLPGVELTTSLGPAGAEGPRQALDLVEPA